MNATLSEVEQLALSLAPADRAALVDHLWESLDGASLPHWEAEWRAEIEKRRTEISECRVKPVPGEEVSRKARELAAGVRS